MILKELHIFNVYHLMSWKYANTHETITTIKVTVISNNSQTSLGLLNYRLYDVEQISRNYSSSISKTLYPLNDSLFSSHPDPSNHYYIFYIYEFLYLRYSVLVESCSTCPSVTSLFHLA